MRGGRYRYLAILFPLMISHTLVSLEQVNIALASVAIAKDFQLTAAALGILGSAFFWGSTSTVIPGGLISQRISAKSFLLVCMGAISATMVALGVAANLEQLVVFRALLGLAIGATFPVSILLVGRWFPGKERGRAMSFLLVGTTLGLIIGGPLTGFLISRVGWRTMFFVEASIPLTMAAVIAHWLVDEPGRATKIGDKERIWLLAMFEEDRHSKDAVELVHWLEVVRRPFVWGIAAVIALNSAASSGIGFFLPTIFGEITKQGIFSISLLTALVALVALVLLVVNGSLSDRFRRREWFALWPPIVAGLGLLIGTRLENTALVFISLFVTAGAVAALGGVAFAWLGDHTSAGQMGFASGLVLFCGAIGSISGPIIVGYVAGSGSPLGGLYPLGILALVAAALVLLVSRAARGNSVKNVSTQLGVSSR